ncbi:hypothetical protein AB0J72_03500 [Dactylosporangium sp. NPDC049742]|uniref:hypothetical protein n=1 Tax=Dactylosporangium sp. NPDC049742 TaxID=3154737 RepID=UPI00343DC5E3
MGMRWRSVIGGLSGLAAAVIWAVCLAIYQPYMEPSPAAEFVGNNTYWPRDIRQLAILLAFGGVVLIFRADLRAVLAAAVGAVIWVGADLALDRAGVSGGAAAVWLAVGGAVAFAGMVFAARTVATPEPGPAHFLTTVFAVAAAVTVLITTPWDEPVTDAADVRVENGLSLLKVVLIVMLAAVTVGLLPLDRLLWALPFAALAALAAWPATATYGWLGALGLVLLPSAAAAAVTATGDVPPLRLLAITGACALALIPAYLLLYFIGSAVGAAMTSLAGNPAIDSADTDLSLATVALLLGLLFATISRAFLASASSSPSSSSSPSAVDSAADSSSASDEAR